MLVTIEMFLIMIMLSFGDQSNTVIQEPVTGYENKTKEELSILTEQAEHNEEVDSIEEIVPMNNISYPNYLGRLIIPEASIDVGMYYSAMSTESMQVVTDRNDSACCFADSPFNGRGFIADHNHQDFRTLTSIFTGTTGYMVNPDGIVVSIVCTEVFDGHNSIDLPLSCIKDANYVPVWDGNSIIMYTCKNGWENVWVTKWVIIQ